MTTVVITRAEDSKLLLAGVVLRDLHCLGVKDALLVEMPASDWAQEADRFIPAEKREPMHAAGARKPIDGAIAYAEKLGFAPHHDYRKARRAFGCVGADDCSETLNHGKDGRPFFFAGPDDDEAKVSSLRPCHGAPDSNRLWAAGPPPGRFRSPARCSGRLSPACRSLPPKSCGRCGRRPG